MFFLNPHQGALSKNVRNSYAEVPPGSPQRKRKSYGFPETPQGALSENVRISYGFPETPPRSPLRKPEEMLWMSCCAPPGALSENQRKSHRFSEVPEGALSEHVRKSYGFPEAT